MYCIEWDDGFGGVVCTDWTDNDEFLKGMYYHLKTKGNTGIKIVQKIDITKDYLKKMGEDSND